MTEMDVAGFPPVSVVLPTYNGATRLPTILHSLRSQDVDQTQVEIIVVDDDSTDDSVAVAESFGARVVRNGAKDPERGKAIGIKAASHDVVMFVDDDHLLPERDWVRTALSAFLEVPDAVGAEPARFAYDRDASAPDRYVSMFGANDPVAFYLGRRDRLMMIEEHWCLAGSVIRETPTYWLVEFSEHGFPPVGAQGFITRKSLIEQTDWWPLYFHIDTNLQLVRNGKTRFVMLKSGIVHHHSDTTARFLAKLRRNMKQFLLVRKMRKYSWSTSLVAIAVTGIKMVTIVVPLYDSLKSFLKTRDAAAFLHVYYSFAVPFIYLKQAIAHRFRGNAAAHSLRERLLCERPDADRDR